MGGDDNSRSAWSNDGAWHDRSSDASTDTWRGAWNSDGAWHASSSDGAWHAWSTMARDDWMPKSNRSRGAAWAINPRSRGCFWPGRQSWQSIRGRGLAWLANRDSQAAVAGLLGWPIVTITTNPRSRGCFSGPWFAWRDRDHVCAASRVKAPLVGWTGWMDWRPRVLAENYKCELQC